jgi:hypothetical protein
MIRINSNDKLAILTGYTWVKVMNLDDLSLIVHYSNVTENSWLTDTDFLVTGTGKR